MYPLIEACPFFSILSKFMLGIEVCKSKYLFINHFYYVEKQQKYYTKKYRTLLKDRNFQNAMPTLNVKCHYLISTTPNLSLNCSKVTLPKPLVMMSAIMLSLGQYLTDIVFCSTCFRTKLYGISICPVRLWNF